MYKIFLFIFLFNVLVIHPAFASDKFIYGINLTAHENRCGHIYFEIKPKNLTLENIIIWPLIEDDAPPPIGILFYDEDSGLCDKSNLLNAKKIPLHFTKGISYRMKGRQQIDLELVSSFNEMKNISEIVEEMK